MVWLSSGGWKVESSSEPDIGFEPSIRRSSALTIRPGVFNVVLLNVSNVRRLCFKSTKEAILHRVFHKCSILILFIIICYYYLPLLYEIANLHILKYFHILKEAVLSGILKFLDSGRKCWALDSGRWTLDATLWTLHSGHWTLLLTGSEQNQNPVSNSTLIKLMKIFWVQISKDIIVMLVL